MEVENIKLNELSSRKWMKILLFSGVILLFISFFIEFSSGGRLQYSKDHGGVLKRFFHSYLFSYAFYMSIVFGAFFFVILQFLTKAGWSVVVRRIPETLMKNIELMIVLTLPFLYGVFELYEWTHADVVESDYILKGKAPYLNLTFFWIRVLVYFVFMFFVARYYYLLSIFQDFNPDPDKTKKLQRYSPLVMLLFALTITFFAIDFLMSLNPHWYSTIWGVYYFTGSVVASLSLVVIIAVVLQGLGYLKKIITVEHYHDLGKLIFTFNVLWSYVAFSQYMLIWYANLPEETLFYLDRINGSWKSVAILLIVGHVAIPLVLFLSRNAKRILPIHVTMVTWMIFMHVVDMYWLVMPVVDRLNFAPSISDISLFLGMGLLFIGYFLKNFRQYSILASNDPYYQESIHFENA